MHKLSTMNLICTYDVKFNLCLCLCIKISNFYIVYAGEIVTEFRRCHDSCRISLYRLLQLLIHLCVIYRSYPIPRRVTIVGIFDSRSWTHNAVASSYVASVRRAIWGHSKICFFIFSLHRSVSHTHKIKTKDDDPWRELAFKFRRKFIVCVNSRWKFSEIFNEHCYEIHSTMLLYSVAVETRVMDLNCFISDTEHYEYQQDSWVLYEFWILNNKSHISLKGQASFSRVFIFAIFLT